MTILVATPQYLTRYVHRNRRTISTAFDLPFLSSRAPYSRGALALDKTRSALSAQECFGPAILNRCGWVSWNIWGLPKSPAWLFAAELREGTVIRLLTPFERTVPILPVRPPAAGSLPKYASSSSTVMTQGHPIS